MIGTDLNTDMHKEQHVVPWDFDRPHIMSPDCWCCPRQDRLNKNRFYHNVLSEDDYAIVRVH